MPFSNKGKVEATPIIGYKGLIEMAYRNPKVKSIRIQSVYENDEFDYEYGTNEYVKHRPTMKGDRGNLTAVYAIAKIDGIDPLFAVVHKPELDRIQKMSKSASSSNSPYNSGIDVFNIMQAKVAIKLLFKTLPKSDNEALIRTLEIDNKFDYQKNVKIVGEETGYDIIEEEPKVGALEEKEMEKIEIEITEDFNELNKEK